MCSDNLLTPSSSSSILHFYSFHLLLLFSPFYPFLSSIFLLSPLSSSSYSSSPSSFPSLLSLPPHPPNPRFDIHLMQTGRMKGQAFVGLPSEEAASAAVRETNGYQLSARPIVVVSLTHAHTHIHTHTLALTHSHAHTHTHTRTHTHSYSSFHSFCSTLPGQLKPLPADKSHDCHLI